ncbi:MAG: hypothetical protein R3327_03120 [Nitrosopumilaceae archaeon]|nr:hypothetical protein [Nitrosopumilaceae archaeon]
MLHEKLKEIDAELNTAKSIIHSKALLPAYGFVRSIEFTILVLVIGIMILAMFLSAAYAESVKIKDIDQIQANQYNVLVDYCKTQSSNQTIGIMFQSSLEFVPIQVDNTQTDDSCKTYGARINALATYRIQTNTFQAEDIDRYLITLEDKRDALDTELVLLYQQLRIEQQTTADENVVSSILAKISQKEMLVQSNKHSIKTLLSLKG